MLEVGCGDAFASRIVSQAVDKLTVTDIDEKLLSNARENNKPPYEFNILKHDFFNSPTQHKYSSCYFLDVLEHIDPKDEPVFLENINSSLINYGKVVIGMPSLESQLYASPASKEGHINCKTKAQFKSTLDMYFKSVTIFSMNDEVLHTGFGPMSHYLLAIAVA